MEPALWAFGRKANMESNFCRQVLITRNQHISTKNNSTNSFSFLDLTYSETGRDLGIH